MADKTKIAWTDASWNPIVGCSKISAGCANCYAEKMAVRLAGMAHMQHKYLEAITQESPYEWSGQTTFTESELEKPLHWKKPRKIFVCSMGDLFHESVPFEWIDKVFAVMALCPQHTFQVLTKRAERMKDYFTTRPAWNHKMSAQSISDNVFEIVRLGWTMIESDAEYMINEWPLPNVWLGVTAENQEMADKRIPILLQTPAAKRFVSVEPMLGAVDLRNIHSKYEDQEWIVDALEGRALCIGSDSPSALCEDEPKLDWVIVGAESGAGRRKCKYVWYSNLVAQCQQANVPVFVKQLHAVGSTKLIKEPAGWPREFPV